MTGLKDGIIQFKESVRADDLDINFRSNASVGRKSYLFYIKVSKWLNVNSCALT